MVFPTFDPIPLCHAPLPKSLTEAWENRADSDAHEQYFPSLSLTNGDRVHIAIQQDPSLTEDSLVIERLAVILRGEQSFDRSWSFVVAELTRGMYEQPVLTLCYIDDSALSLSQVTAAVFDQDKRIKVATFTYGPGENNDTNMSEFGATVLEILEDTDRNPALLAPHFIYPFEEARECDYDMPAFELPKRKRVEEDLQPPEAEPVKKAKLA